MRSPTTDTMTEHLIADASALNGWHKSSYGGNEGGSVPAPARR